MKTADLKTAFFSLGMGTAIASSLLSMYILMISLMGRQSLIYEENPIVAIAEMLLLTFSVATCVVSSEMYQRYQKRNDSEKRSYKWH